MVEEKKPEIKKTPEKAKPKVIKVKSLRVLNLGKLEGPRSAMIHFQPGEEKEVPYTDNTQATIDWHIEVGLLEKVK